MPKPVFPNYEEVNFEIEKEVWNVYELDDRSTIKMRAILVKLLKPLAPTEISPPQDTPQQTMEFQSAFQNIVTVIKSPLELMGKPTPILPPQQLVKLKKIEVGYTPYREDWNIYRLPDENRLKVKLIVSTVYRILERYDPFGYPVYFVNSTNAIAPVPKAEF